MLRRIEVDLPLPLLIYVVAALVVSMIAHVFCAVSLLQNQLHFCDADNTDTAEYPPEIPLSLSPVALTLVKSRRLGLYANDSDWDALLPRGAGFVYLESANTHFLVSHYHQLHCIHALRTYFRASAPLAPKDLSHVDHCLGYLHQSTLCNVDTTLEPASHRQLTPDGRPARVVTGVGVIHRCTNWVQMREYVEHNYDQWQMTY